MQVDAVLVWVNPIQDGHDRTILDQILRDMANKGVFVSTHPDIILKMGTKEVLCQTRHMGWGSDAYLYSSLDQLQQELPLRLARGEARVLKQYREHSVLGIWKVQLAEAVSSNNVIHGDTPVKFRHAQRGSVEEVMSMYDVYKICEQYFVGAGRLIDQAYQSRLPEGMIRCYLTYDKVVGFGHQAINALYPAPEGGSSAEAPQPGPRL